MQSSPSAFALPASLRSRTALQMAALCALALGTAQAADSPAPAPDAAKPDAPAAPQHAPVYFEGTDLHIGKAPPITFHGFASQGFLYSTDYNYLGDTTDGSFEFTELGLNMSMNPLPRTRIAAQAFTFDIGDVNNFDVFLDYASIEYTFDSRIGARGGRIRRPGGIYNHIQDLDLARTSVLLPQGIYDARWRDFSTSIDGGELFGNIPLGKVGGLSYELFAGLMNLSEDGGVAHWIVDGQPGAEVTSFEQPLVVGGQLWWNTPLDGLRAGAMLAQIYNLGFDLTAPVSPIGPFGPIVARAHAEGDAFMQQYSLEYTIKSWTFQAEYFTYNYEYTQSQNVYSGPVLVDAQSVDTSQQPDAWYVGASYRFNKWLETGLYYTEFYPNIHDRSGNPTRYQDDLALSFRFDPTDWWIFKVEGHLIRGTALLQDWEHNPVRDDDPWFMLALKTTFTF